MNVQSVCNAGRLLLLVYLSLLIYYGGKHHAEFSGATRNEQMDVCKEKKLVRITRHPLTIFSRLLICFIVPVYAMLSGGQHMHNR